MCSNRVRMGSATSPHCPDTLQRLKGDTCLKLASDVRTPAVGNLSLRDSAGLRTFHVRQPLVQNATTDQFALHCPCLLMTRLRLLPKYTLTVKL